MYARRGVYGRIIYYGVVVLDKDSMYQESIETLYCDFIRHLKYYV